MVSPHQYYSLPSSLPPQLYISVLLMVSPHQYYSLLSSLSSPTIHQCVGDGITTSVLFTTLLSPSPTIHQCVADGIATSVLFTTLLSPSPTIHQCVGDGIAISVLLTTLLSILPNYTSVCWRWYRHISIIDYPPLYPPQLYISVLAMVSPYQYYSLPSSLSSPTIHQCVGDGIATTVLSLPSSCRPPIIVYTCN